MPAVIQHWSTGISPATPFCVCLCWCINAMLEFLPKNVTKVKIKTGYSGTDEHFFSHPSAPKQKQCKLSTLKTIYYGS